MRKNYFLIFGVLLLVWISCRKDRSSESETVPDGLITAAKSMYEVPVNVRTNSAGIGKSKNSLPKALWDHAKYIILTNGERVLAVPTKKFDLGNKKIGVIRNIVFFIKGSSLSNGNIISYYGDPGYLEAHKDDIFKSYKDPTISGFSGPRFIANLDGSQVEGVVYKNGVLVKNAKAYIRTRKNVSINNGKQVASTLKTMDEGNCLDWYWVTDNGDGTENWEYLYETCDGGGESGGGSGGGGGGTHGNGNGGNDAGNPDPCGQAQAMTSNSKYVSKMQDLKTKTSLNYEVGYFFGNDGSKDYDYQYIQGNPGEASIEAQPGTTINGFVHTHYTGTFNTFSPSDVRAIFVLDSAKSIQDISSFTAAVISTNENYIIKVNDVQKYKDFSAANLTYSKFNSFEQEFQNYTTVYQQIYGKSPDEARTLALTKVLEDSGLTLLKGGANFDSYQSLSETNNNLQTSNCN